MYFSNWGEHGLYIAIKVKNFSLNIVSCLQFDYSPKNSY